MNFPQRQHSGFSEPVAPLFHCHTQPEKSDLGPFLSPCGRDSNSSRNRTSLFNKRRLPKEFTPLILCALSRRAVVQLGRTLEWGSRGREFESRRPDHASLQGCHFARTAPTAGLLLELASHRSRRTTATHHSGAAKHCTPHSRKTKPSPQKPPAAREPIRSKLQAGRQQEGWPARCSQRRKTNSAG